MASFGVSFKRRSIRTGCCAASAPNRASKSAGRGRETTSNDSTSGGGRSTLAPCARRRLTAPSLRPPGGAYAGERSTNRTCGEKVSRSTETRCELVTRCGRPLRRRASLKPAYSGRGPFLRRGLVPRAGAPSSGVATGLQYGCGLSLVHAGVKVAESAPAHRLRWCPGTGRAARGGPSPSAASAPAAASAGRGAGACCAVRRCCRDCSLRL